MTVWKVWRVLKPGEKTTWRDVVDVRRQQRRVLVATADSVKAARPWLGDKRFNVEMADAEYMPLLVPVTRMVAK